MFASHCTEFAGRLGRTDLAALLAASEDVGPQDGYTLWCLTPLRSGEWAGWVFAGFLPIENSLRVYPTREEALEAFVASAAREYAAASQEVGATGPVRVSRTRRGGRTIGFALSREGADLVEFGAYAPTNPN